MMRSLSSAVTGLRAQQTAMDIIGNNIANINTTGFKSSVTNFEDLFYQTLNGGNMNVNPSQVGYGTQVASVSKDMTSGGATTTDSGTDLYINGEGYFAVNTKADGTGTTYYTRVGSFHFNTDGYLVDSNGNYVMNNFFTGTNTANTESATPPVPPATPDKKDYAIHLGDITGSTSTNTVSSYASVLANDGSGKYYDIPAANVSQITNIAINKDGTITGTYNGVTGTITNLGGTATGGAATANADITTATNTNVIGLVTFTNESGLTQVGDNYYEASTSSGAPGYRMSGVTTPAANPSELESSALEMSNVDLSREFTNMIVTERGFQANSRVITVSDTMLDELLNLKRS